MATTIKLKNSVTTTAAPSSLSQGEAAVNVTDKKVWVGNAASSPVQILGAGATVSGTDATFTGNVTLGDASGDALTINSSAVSIPNGLNFDSNTFVIDATNNRVGVGTASPNAPIHSVLSGSGVSVNVAATGQAGLQMTSGTATNPYMNWYSSGTTLEASLFAVAGSGAFAIGTGASGAERMRIDSAGRVCIATQIAESNLTVYGTSTAPSATTLSSGTLNIKGSSTLRLLIGTDPSSPYGAWLQTTDGAGAGYPISLNPLGGNVGIGTSSPSGRLSVTTSTMTNQIIADSMSDSTTYGLVSLNASRVSTGYLGIAGGGGTDKTLFLNVPTGGKYSFRNNFSEQMQLDSSGNLGLGVTPSAWETSSYKAIDINSAVGGIYGGASRFGLTNNAYLNTSGVWTYKTTGYATRYQSYNGEHQFYTAPSSTGAITFTQAMTLDTSGNLGIGQTNPSAWLTNGIGIGSGSSDWGATIYTGTASSGYLCFADGTTTTDRYRGYLQYTHASDAMVFATAATERMRIDSSGNLLVGTTDTSNSAGSGIKLKPAGNGSNAPILAIVTTGSTGASANFQVYSTTAAAYRFYVTDAGQIYATSTSITGISDISLKENVKDLETGLAEVMALKPRRFDWKNGDATNVAGFIAQEVAEVLPELVSDYKYSDTETKKSLKMGDMLPTLVKAIQELKATIDFQSTEIASLKAQLNK